MSDVPIYPSGEAIHAGDRIRLGGRPATVVFVVELNEYGRSFPKSEWEFVESGIGVLPEGGELVVFDVFCTEDGVELLSRGAV